MPPKEKAFLSEGFEKQRKGRKKIWILKQEQQISNKMS